jgi:hypothetical protein
MSVRIVTVENNNKNKNSSTIEWVFFIALNLLVIPFSAYQTYIGYEKDVAGHQILAMVVALISAVLFGAMNFGIREKRLKGQRHFLMIIMYIIPLGLSFFGNFNAFYSNQMKETLLRSEVSNYKHQLTTTRDEAVSALVISSGIAPIQAEYDKLWDDLRTEYFEAAQPDWGPKSETKWVELVNFLNSEGGRISISDKGKFKPHFIRNAETFSKNTLNTILKTRQDLIDPELKYINDKYTPVIKNIDSLTGLSRPRYESRMLDNMVQAENEIRSRTASFIGTEEIFSNTPLKPSGENEIGTIKHTIDSAFNKKENPSATWFSLFLSLIIDLAALLYIMVFIPYKISGRKGRINKGPQRI